MKLLQLSLINFRNYQHLETEFHGGVNLFIGANAQGKTNLLEACHLLSTGRSHRTFRDFEMIKWEKESYHIKGLVQKRSGNDLLELHVNRQGKKIVKINGQNQSKLASLLGRLNVVFFAPEHLELVKGDPSIRRRFLDMAISQISPSYLHNLSQYLRILQQKNALLKEDKPDLALLDIYQRQIAEHSHLLIKKRIETIKVLERFATVKQKELNKQENLEIVYKSSFKSEDDTYLIEDLYDQIKKREKDELSRRSSLFGPHRDDFIISINKQNSRFFASQGQQRSIVLSLKMSEAMLIEKETNEKPVIILDDVLSELDRERQQLLIGSLQSFSQTFISSTYLPPILSELQGYVFHVENGTVVLKNKPDKPKII